VIVDVCDALEDGPALALYTERFYRDVKNRLTPGGLLAVQAMELSELDYADHVTVHRTLRYAFTHVQSYSTFIPSFWSSWGFVAASDTADVAALTAETVDAVLAERGITGSLDHYDGETHRHMFSLPKGVRKALSPDSSTP